MSARKKAIREYDDMLKKHIEKKHVIKFCRTFGYRAANAFGYLLLLSEHFLLIQIADDFVVDGYAIIPKNAFDGIRYNKYDKTLTKIMEAEGLAGSVGIAREIDLTDWQTIFTCLQQLDIHVIVERESLKNARFLIGPVADVRKKTVGVQYYDATGRLDTKPTRVRYKDITMIKFGDKYTETFRKYLKPAKSKGSEKQQAGDTVAG